MRKLIVSMAMLLVGCSARTETPPAVVEVKVPVLQKCDIRQPDAPAFAVASLPVGAPIDVQMRALRAERHQRQGYEILLRAEIDKCKK